MACEHPFAAQPFVFGLSNGISSCQSMSKCAQKLWNEFAHAQVLNDLLDPSRANLKLREDPKRGFYVEGIKEETLVSAEHALSVIATGIAHRKV